MKNFKLFATAMAMFTLILTSCSEDREGIAPGDDKATLSFSALLNDLEDKNSGLKQTTSQIPACSDASVAYVEIILSHNGTPIVGAQGNPFRLDLVTGQLFTVEVPELELEPGQYSLDYFVVYDAMGTATWVAPVAGSDLAGFVDTPLPLAINLGAGVKKYIDVPVLCFDDRMVNAYGYMFFDLIPSQAIEWCIFGNYCDETGRHYPAQFSINVWNYSNGEIGSALYSSLSNTVELNANGDYAGTPLCIALPDTAGLDEYYVQITLENSDAYGAITPRIIREGVITDTDVRSLFSGADAVDYFHFREGCGGGDSPDLFLEDQEVATYYGPAIELGDGMAMAMVKLNSSGELEAIGVKFSEEALLNLPEGFQDFTLYLPEETGNVLFDHIDLEWNPHGHEPPGVYDIPHFDFHFYWISEEEKMMINSEALADVLPANEFWPNTYVPTPGFVPMMGKHWLSLASPEANDEIFSQTFIYGSYNGKFIFHEPMITIDYFNEKTSTQYVLHQPAAYQREGYRYPTMYSINYDEAEGMYTVILENMVQR